MFTNIVGSFAMTAPIQTPGAVPRDSEHPAETAIAVHGADILVTGGQPAGLAERQLDLDRTLFLQLLVDGIYVQGRIGDDGVLDDLARRRAIGTGLPFRAIRPCHSTPYSTEAAAGMPRGRPPSLPSGGLVPGPRRLSIPVLVVADCGRPIVAAHGRGDES